MVINMVLGRHGKKQEVLSQQIPTVEDIALRCQRLRRSTFVIKPILVFRSRMKPSVKDPLKPTFRIIARLMGLGVKNLTA